MKVCATSPGCFEGTATAGSVTIRGPTSPALASPSKSTVLRYSHSFEVAVSFFDGSACSQTALHSYDL